MREISNFDVLKRMSLDDKNIRLATSDNLLNMQKVKAGTQMTFGVAGDVINQIFHNELHCCLLIWDNRQFQEAKEAMEDETNGGE